jgi:HAE1 family hydrophobic/amphiphilic exporter-1
LVLKVAGGDRMGLRGVLDLTLVNERGEPVVLRNVVSTAQGIGPPRIERKDQQRVVTVSANFTGRNQSEVIEDLRAALHTIPVPQGFAVVLGAGYEEQQAAFRELMLMFALSLAFVYMVMACQYESLRHPLAVMFSVPLAAVGVLVTLFLTDTTFNIQSFIGCIMLGGIVVNNAILLVDHVNLLRERDGMGLYPAVAEAGRRRLRPILMTASTTVLGLVPLALGIGEGGEAQAPMARAVIGGLLSSTAITLYLVPVVYTFLDPERSKS